jgi:hypothetical protein
MNARRQRVQIAHGKPPGFLTAYLPPALQVSVLSRKDQYGEDLNGVMEMIVYGLKGMCAYGDHAAQVWRGKGPDRPALLRWR